MNDRWYNLSIPRTSYSENHGMHGNPTVAALLPGVHHWPRQWKSLDLRSTSSRCGHVYREGWYLGSQLDQKVSRTGKDSKSDLSHFARVWSTYWLPPWSFDWIRWIFLSTEGHCIIGATHLNINSASCHGVNHRHPPTRTQYTQGIFLLENNNYPSMAPNVCPSRTFVNLPSTDTSPKFRCHFGPPCHPCYLGNMPIGKETSWFPWKAQHNGRNFRMEPLYTVISLEINHVQVQLLASSIFEPNLKCLWLFSQMPAWKDKATSKATREDRTRLTSRIKMEWMFEAKGKIEGIWHKDFGNCNSKLFQNLESLWYGARMFQQILRTSCYPGLRH